MMKFDEYTKQSKNLIREIKSSQWKAPLKRILKKRKFHAYCVGSPKSGTHSINSMLNDNYRSKHEPLDMLSIKLLHDCKNNTLSEMGLDHFLRMRDIYLWCEMEASHFNGSFCTTLHTIFPKAKFILTLRDCYTWVDSWFNHQLSRKFQPKDSIWSVGRDLYYNSGNEYSKYDKILEEHSLLPLSGYLEFWNRHNRKVIDSIPKENLLIIKTNEINDSQIAMSNFLEIPSSTISIDKSHSFKAKKKMDILKKIDPEYLKDQFEMHCGALMKEYFPDLDINYLDI